MDAVILSLFESLKLPFNAFLGAITLYILNRLGGKHPFSLFQALNINVSGPRANPAIVGLDMIISSALGAFVVIPLTQPTTIAQAIMAGLGMTGVLAVNVKEPSK